jgi:AcrR family transcriptional regulator
MRSDGEATRARILDAAAHEFAEHGLAGARVDRIAASASASKERLYAYFGDKRSLFVAVLTDHMQDITDSMPMSPRDLVGFVGGIFDFAQENPEHFRMMQWAKLSGDLDLLPEVPAAVVERDARVIAEAQALGLADPEWSPRELFGLLFALATSEVYFPLSEPDSADLARKRAAVVRGAAKLIAVPAAAIR